MNKTEKARQLFLKGDHIGSLRIVSKFRNLGNHSHQIKLAMDCHNNPNFYKQLGKDTDLEVSRGIEALREFLGL